LLRKGILAPPMMGPRPKIFKPIFGRGISQRGQAHRIPIKKRYSLCRACSRFNLWVGWVEGRYPQVNAYCLFVSTARPFTSGLGLRRKPDTSGGTPSSRVIMIAPEIFQFFEKIPIQIPFAKAFQYTNDMEK
jgi:hypothetical protein